MIPMSMPSSLASKEASQQTQWMTLAKKMVSPPRLELTRRNAVPTRSWLKMWRAECGRTRNSRELEAASDSRENRIEIP